jgi:hypothetical protein
MQYAARWDVGAHRFCFRTFEARSLRHRPRASHQSPQTGVDGTAPQVPESQGAKVCSRGHALRHAATSCTHPVPDGSQCPLRGLCLGTYWTACPPPRKACSGGHALRRLADEGRSGSRGSQRLLRGPCPEMGPRPRPHHNACSGGYALRSADVAVREAQWSAVFQHNTKCFLAPLPKVLQIALLFSLQVREFIAASRGWGRRCGPAHQLPESDARPPIPRLLAHAQWLSSTELQGRQVDKGSGLISRQSWVRLPPLQLLQSL